MDKARIEEIEMAMREEHRRDEEALDRLKRFLPSNGTNSGNSKRLFEYIPKNDRLDPINVGHHDSLEDIDEALNVVTLRGKIGQTMASDPTKGWTGKKMLKALEEAKFAFAARKPINSVAIAMNYWVKRGFAHVTKRGSGRIPNVIKWLPDKPFPRSESDESEDTI